MQDTNQKSSSPSNLIDVDVLLATYNGEKYLTEFLTSLSKQVGVKINLLVSDDGSNDSTIKIIEKFREKFQNVKVFNGPKKGPAANFIFLVNQAKGKYIALADQDDIWLDSKLIKGIADMEEASGPILQICSFETLNGRYVSGKPNSLPISVIRNRTQGCTMMFNRELLKILNKSKLSEIVMHDWAILLIAQSVGSVVYSCESRMKYRIHRNNFVGISRFDRRAWLFFRSLAKRGSDLDIFLQATAIYATLPSNSQYSAFFGDFISAVEGSFGVRVKYIFLNRKAYLNSPTHTLSAIKLIRGTYR